MLRSLIPNREERCGFGCAPAVSKIYIYIYIYIPGGGAGFQIRAALRRCGLLFRISQHSQIQYLRQATSGREASTQIDIVLSWTPEQIPHPTFAVLTLQV